MCCQITQSRNPCTAARLWLSVCAERIARYQPVTRVCVCVFEYGEHNADTLRRVLRTRSHPPECAGRCRCCLCVHEYVRHHWICVPIECIECAAATVTSTSLRMRVCLYAACVCVHQQVQRGVKCASSLQRTHCYAQANHSDSELLRSESGQVLVGSEPVFVSDLFSRLSLIAQ